jgi:hypothetical protein
MNLIDFPNPTYQTGNFGINAQIQIKKISIATSIADVPKCELASELGEA